MNFDRSQKKEIERLAVNAPNLKDFGTDGKHKGGKIKKGYYRLKDNRIIRLSDLHLQQAKESAEEKEVLAELKTLAINYPNLHNCKGLGIDKDGNVKKGFLKLDDGKVVSIKKLNEAHELATKDVIDAKTVA